jgi:hypothetical protein
LDSGTKPQLDEPPMTELQPMTLVPPLRALTALAAGGLRAGRGQTVYLILTLGIATAAWLLLAAVATPVVSGTSDSGSGTIIRNGSQRGALPLHYAHRIEAIRGASAVYWYGIQVVNCTAATTVALYALGGPGRHVYLAKQKVPAVTVQRWNADPLGVVISDAAASKCGWRVGQGVDPPSGMEGDGKHVDLHIIGTFPGSSPLGLVHYDYINRAAPGIQGKDKVVTFFASAGNPRNNEVLAARIEAAFAHDFPSVNVTTNATEQNAWARFGKVQQLLAFVMAAILLCVASVLVSVLAHTAAQRRPRFALLQVLGFRRATLLGAFTLELLATVVLGALLGLGLARLAAYELASTFFGVFADGAPAWAWWGLPAWLAVLAVVALAWPAGQIARVQPVDYRAI